MTSFGLTRLVAMIRSAYGIRIVGVGVLDDPSEKFDLDGQNFPQQTSALRMEMKMFFRHRDGWRFFIAFFQNIHYNNCQLSIFHF